MGCLPFLVAPDLDKPEITKQSQIKLNVQRIKNPNIESSSACPA
jgi:hypothetical protein